MKTHMEKSVPCDLCDLKFTTRATMREDGFDLLGIYDQFHGQIVTNPDLSVIIKLVNSNTTLSECHILFNYAPVHGCMIVG